MIAGQSLGRNNDGCASASSTRGASGQSTAAHTFATGETAAGRSTPLTANPIRQKTGRTEVQYRWGRQTFSPRILKQASRAKNERHPLPLQKLLSPPHTRSGGSSKASMQRGFPARLSETRDYSQTGILNGGKVFSSIGLWDSSHGGSFKCVPNWSTGSSKAKPGGSVAISKSTPPGSRK